MVKKVFITGGAGFIGSRLAMYFQKNYPDSRIVIFDCFRNNQKFDNGNLKSFGHYSNIIGFKGDVICGDINSKIDLDKLSLMAFEDPSTGGNPKKITKEDLKEMYKKSISGELF